MSALIDRAGMRYGRLSVAYRFPLHQGRCHAASWVCHCDCGRSKIVRGYDLERGRTRSCGCLQKEAAARLGSRPRSSILAHPAASESPAS